MVTRNDKVNLNLHPFYLSERERKEIEKDSFENMAVNHVHVLICYGLYLLLDLAKNAMGQLISIYPFSFQEHIYLIFFPLYHLISRSSSMT